MDAKGRVCHHPDALVEYVPFEIFVRCNQRVEVGATQVSYQRH
jgi:hypothetical protein